MSLLLCAFSAWLWVTIAMSENELLATAGMDALVSVPPSADASAPEASAPKPPPTHFTAPGKFHVYSGALDAAL
jgi:hypothetical protein